MEMNYDIDLTESYVILLLIFCALIFAVAALRSFALGYWEARQGYRSAFWAYLLLLVVVIIELVRNV